jgi:hypothetical protein
MLTAPVRSRAYRGLEFAVGTQGGVCNVLLCDTTCCSSTMMGLQLASTNQQETFKKRSRTYHCIVM